MMYTRGTSAVRVPMERGRLANEVMESSGLLTGEFRQDWLVDKRDLKIDGAMTEPKPGDRIKVSDGEIFEVMGFTGQKCFEESDSGLRYRIHTKHVDTAP